MANFQNVGEEELKLAQELKENYCDETGKETNVIKSAEILHRIALIYRSRSDKVSLIRCVGLLNAALARKPTNYSQIKLYLSEVCQQILNIANAKQQKANLIQKGNKIKKLFIKLRPKVKLFLKKEIQTISASENEVELQQKISNKIALIQQINKEIAEEYTNAMRDISQFCQNVMGQPPCEYAVVGMGSLARQEITPYSDFEHIIVLCDDENYETHLDYFRWFSVIFHVVVLNIQETIIPALHICSLNDDNSKLGNWFYDDVTVRGVSFDGLLPYACKFPLGRQTHTAAKQFTTELIKPVSEMLKYLSSEADIKNGYHLADILTKTCYVFGNKDLFEQFSKSAKTLGNQKLHKDIIFSIQEQVKDDLRKFAARLRLSNLKNDKKINIKQIVYRSTTIFIAALASVNNISENSSFDVIDKMEKKNILTQTTAFKLKYAVAIACEMRLRVYANNECQCDTPMNFKQRNKKIQRFLEIVGIASTVNYFQIAYCLQCEVAKQLKLTKLHFYSDPQLINFTIGLAFGIRSLISFDQSSQKPSGGFKRFQFDECIKQLEAKADLKQTVFDKIELKFVKSKLAKETLTEAKVKLVIDFLFDSNEYDEALEFSTQLLDIYEKKSKNIDSDSDVALVNHQIGYCLNELKQPEVALKYFNRAFKITQNTNDANVDRSIVTILHNIGFSHIDLHQYDVALQYLDRALKIFQNRTYNDDQDRDIATTLHTIGRCHIDLHQYDVALQYLRRALKIKQDTTNNAYKDRSIANTLHTIGRCHIDLHQYDVALQYLNRARTIKQNATNDVDNDRSLAITLREVGRCLIGLEQFDSSWSNLQQALTVLQKTTTEELKDPRIGRTFTYMGECLSAKHQHAEALPFYDKSVRIWQGLANTDKNPYFAKALLGKGICLINLHEYANALELLKQSLATLQKFAGK